MKTTPRPILLLILLTLVLGLLPACGGSGGGGGGSGVLPDGGDTPTPGGDFAPPVISLEDGQLKPIRYLDDIIVFQPGHAIDFRNSPGMSKTDVGIQITYSDKIDFLTGEGAQASEFSAGAKFISGQKLLPVFREEYLEPVGSSIMQYSYAIYLGGKRLGLEYADFGIWLAARHYQYSSPDEDKDLIGIVGFGPFWTQAQVDWPNEDKHRRPPAEGQEFAGTVIAAVKNNDTADAALFSGTAHLEVPSQLGAESWQGQLELIFDNYYNFKLSNIRISDAGFMSRDFASSDIEITGENNLGNSEFNFDRNKSSTGDLGGRFHGPEGASASEAVGAFGIYNGNVNVHGAFGVKEKKEVSP